MRRSNKSWNLRVAWSRAVFGGTESTRNAMYREEESNTRVVGMCIGETLKERGEVICLLAAIRVSR